MAPFTHMLQYMLKCVAGNSDVLRPNKCDRALVKDAQVEHPEFSKVGMVLCLDSPPQPLNDTTNDTESAKALTVVVFFFLHLDIRNPSKPYQKALFYDLYFE